MSQYDFSPSQFREYHEVSSWADAFGIWHVKVTTDSIGHAPGVIATAYTELIDQICARENMTESTRADFQARVGIERVQRPWRTVDGTIHYLFRERLRGPEAPLVPT